IPRILLFESFLSFLGLGVEAPRTSLGVLSRAGIDSVTAVLVGPWTIATPAAVLGVLLLCVNVLGDAVRDAFDPRSAPRPEDEPAPEAAPRAAPPVAAAAVAGDVLLSVRDLHVEFATPRGGFHAVRGASFS